MFYLIKLILYWNAKTDEEKNRMLCELPIIN